MALIKWEPFNELEGFFDDHFLPSLPNFSKIGWDLAVDLYEDGGNMIAKMNVPGVDIKDIDVSVEDETLHISGKREEEKEVKEKDYYSKEIRNGSFSRILSLPKAVDPEKVKADYKDGVLIVTMPVMQDQKKGAVKVEVKK